ncbi:MAG: hypothetical protein Q9203_006131 [Teloschistes exilis]
MTDEIREPNQAYRPTERADVDRTVSTQPQIRERRWEMNQKLRKKDEEGFFTIDVTIVDWEYDEAKHEWMYKLEDYQSRPIEGLTKEDDME